MKLFKSAKKTETQKSFDDQIKDFLLQIEAKDLRIERLEKQLIQVQAENDQLRRQIRKSNCNKGAMRHKSERIPEIDLKKITVDCVCSDDSNE